MKLDDIYSIERDELSYQLIETRTYIAQKGKEEGNEVISATPYYYPTLSATLRGYVNKVADISGDVKKLIESIDRLEIFIEKLIKDELEK